MKLENMTLDERFECASYLASDFALKCKKDQQGILLQWMRYAEMMRRETGAGMQGATKMFLLPGSNTTLVCANAMARMIGFSRRAWGTVKEAYLQKAIPMHGLIGKAGNKKNQSYEDLMVEFFERTKTLAEPRATKIIRHLVDDQIQVDFRDDDDKLDLPVYMTKRGMYKKLLAECHWEYSYNSKCNIIEKKRINADATPSVPSWPLFLAFWKKHYPDLVIQSSSENICGDCHVFANAYKTLASKKSKASNKNNTDSDDSDDSTGDDDDEEQLSTTVPDLDEDDTGKDGCDV
jgi:hypothetical protein